VESPGNGPKCAVGWKGCFFLKSAKNPALIDQQIPTLLFVMGVAKG